MEILKWEYLGDGVYLGYDGYGFWLHANDHLWPTDKIYLEPQVLDSLKRMTTKMEKDYSTEKVG